MIKGITAVDQVVQKDESASVFIFYSKTRMSLVFLLSDHDDFLVHHHGYAWANQETRCATYSNGIKVPRFDLPDDPIHNFDQILTVQTPKKMFSRLHNPAPFKRGLL